MSKKYNQYQIDRKDAKNCFIESLSDFFANGKVHFNFITYDTSRPENDRITNYVNIYIEIDKFLEFCRKMESGELRYIIGQKINTSDNTPIEEWLGGIPAKKLAESGRSRPDGMSLSRVAKLLCGNKSDFLFVADSGAGEQNKKGLIVPRFGKNPENHVAVSLSWESLAELCLLTKEHYKAWLSSWYLVRMMSDMQTAGNMSYNKTGQITNPQNTGALPQMYDVQMSGQSGAIQDETQYAGYQQQSQSGDQEMYAYKQGQNIPSAGYQVNGQSTVQNTGYQVNGQSTGQNAGYQVNGQSAVQNTEYQVSEQSAVQNAEYQIDEQYIAQNTQQVQGNAYDYTRYQSA